MADITLRKAVPGDAEVLSAFAERTFRETFGPDNNPADMDLYCLQAFSPQTQAVEIADPSIETLLVCDAEGALVAYAQLRAGPTPVEVNGPGPIELVRFYLERVRHGGGIAPRLMEAVLATARARGAETLWLGVWERNDRAQAFYRKAGFVDVGAHEFAVGTDIQTDRVMARSIGTATGSM